MEKSPDAFRTISEVAEWLDTPAHVLRFWESKFAQVKPVKRAGGRRYYRPSDMALLGGIKVLLHDQGMTIKGVQKMLSERGVRAVAALSAPVDGAADQAPSRGGDAAAAILGSMEDAAGFAADAEPDPETMPDEPRVVPFAEPRSGIRDAPAEGHTEADARIASDADPRERAGSGTSAQPNTAAPGREAAEPGANERAAATDEAASHGALEATQGSDSSEPAATEKSSAERTVPTITSDEEDDSFQGDLFSDRDRQARDVDAISPLARASMERAPPAPDGPEPSAVTPPHFRAEDGAPAAGTAPGASDAAKPADAPEDPTPRIPTASGSPALSSADPDIPSSPEGPAPDEAGSGAEPEADPISHTHDTPSRHADPYDGAGAARVDVETGASTHEGVDSDADAGFEEFSAENAEMPPVAATERVAEHPADPGPGLLARAARIDRLTPDQAARLAPLAARLRAIVDR